MRYVLIPPSRPATLITGQSLTSGGGNAILFSAFDTISRLLRDQRFGESFDTITMAKEIAAAFRSTDIAVLSDAQWKLLCEVIRKPLGEARYDSSYAHMIHEHVSAVLVASDQDPRTTPQT